MSQTVVAILLLLACNLGYTLGYAIARILADTLSPFEVTFLRSALVLLAAFGLSFRRRAPSEAWVHAQPRPAAAVRQARTTRVVNESTRRWGQVREGRPRTGRC